MSVKTEELSNWKFRQVGKHADWKESHDRNASTTEIFPDLIAQGIIQDPYKDRNESDVQWVGEADWEYQTVFDVDLEQPHKRQLAFKGLDTFAEVFLNGSSILKTENMWREYIVDLNKDHLSAGSNTLHIVFKSPLGVDRPFEPHSLIDSLDSSRMFVRKAQYHYGWDWGPVLLSSGIFRPVQLLTYKSAYLKDVFVDYNVADTKDGSLQFNIKTELSDKVAGATIKHEILDEGNFYGPLVR
jgi:beta-mannosidase